MKGDWGNWSGLPDGGIDARKYAAIVHALARARGSLYDLLIGEIDVEEIKETLNRTLTSAIAKALGLKESDLSIDWEDHLTWDERERLRIGPEGKF